MPDFSTLLRKPAGTHKRPPALPAGNYTGVIKSFEYGDSNKNKTPYVRFQIGLIGWPDDVADSDKSADTGEGAAPIDLSKKQLRRDFFLTDDAFWRLDELIKSCGVAGGRDYESTIPELVGAQVVAEVQQYMNQTTNEIGNQLGAVKGAS